MSCRSGQEPFVSGTRVEAGEGRPTPFLRLGPAWDLRARGPSLSISVPSGHNSRN